MLQGIQQGSTALSGKANMHNSAGRDCCQQPLCGMRQQACATRMLHQLRMHLPEDQGKLFAVSAGRRWQQVQFGLGQYQDP